MRNTKNNTKNKYGAVRVRIDGIDFDSRAEARRYVDLKMLEKAGEIRNLELQPKFECVVDGTKICTYRADFQYFCGNERVVEDVKGVKTPVYRLKKKLVEALFRGIKITEIK
jgi:hypothetical protein|tara:strand:+ start:836 stop:1171 length:336 start_codon:yes stop_codon:yes gene_type:complete